MSHSYTTLPFPFSHSLTLTLSRTHEKAEEDPVVDEPHKVVEARACLAAHRHQLARQGLRGKFK